MFAATLKSNGFIIYGSITWIFQKIILYSNKVKLGRYEVGKCHMMFDIINYVLIGRMRGEVGKETPKKKEINLNVFL